MRVTFRFRGVVINDVEVEEVLLYSRRQRDPAGRCCLFGPLRIPAAAASSRRPRGTCPSSGTRGRFSAFVSSPLSAWFSAKTTRTTARYPQRPPTAPVSPSSPRRRAPGRKHLLEGTAAPSRIGKPPRRLPGPGQVAGLAGQVHTRRRDTGQSGRRPHAPFATRQPRDMGSDGDHKTGFCLARGLGCGLLRL